VAASSAVVRASEFAATRAVRYRSKTQRAVAPMQVTSILLLVVIAFAWVAFKVFNCLRTMRIHMGVGVIVSKYENPLLFWLVIALQCLAMGALLGVIYAACFILPNSVMS
jgi:hypothetical protein